jgi:hypothetical protein
VAGTGDQALQEHDAAAERALRLQAGALVRVGQVIRAAYDPDAPPAAARGRLEHQRVPDLVRGAQGRVKVRHGAATPRRDGYADLLGDQLRPDLVAQLAHRLGARTDEGDAVLLAHLDEGRVFGDEPPAHPGRVRPGLDQCLGQDRVIEVRAGRGWTQAVAVIGFADERGAALDVGV